MRNVIESSKGKEPAATSSRSPAPSQGANSLAWSTGLLGAMPPPAPRSRLPVHDPRWRSGRARSDCSLPPAPPAGGVENKTMQLARSLAGTRLRFDSLRSACSPLAHYAPLDRAQEVPFATLRFARRPPALYLATLGQLNRAREIFLSPTRPPRAPVRTIPPLALRDARPDCSLPPAPPAGGSKNKKMQLMRSLAGTRLLCAPPGARSLITLRSIERRRSPSLHFVSLGDLLPSISLLWDS